MSKGILIVDMPHSMCRQCILLERMTLNHIVEYWCGAERLTIENPNVIQDFCPIKPMPQKFGDEFDCPHGFDYMVGWNDCIDELLKGEEENK